MPTLVEVAKAAGVSRSTAARALSGQPNVDAKTRARVLSTAEILGYRVNRMASALRVGRSHLIGLVITNLVNASIQTVTQVVQAQARARGYQVLLGATQGDPEVEAKIVQTLVENRVDGLILMGSDENTDQTNGFVCEGLPVVNLIRRPSGSMAPSVLPDNHQSTYEATRYLLGLGHREIAFIGGPTDVASGRERLAGYNAALAEAGVQAQEGLVRHGPFEPEFGSEAVTQLYNSGKFFSALVVANHEAIFGVLPQLVHEGVSIPDELSLVAIEDVPWFTAWHPPITVMDINAALVGETAFESLILQIDGEPQPVGSIIRPGVQLVVRGSCTSLAETITSGFRTPNILG